MNIEVIFDSWLLQIMLQWTWESRYFLEIWISFPLDICLEGGFLGHMVVLFLIFLRCPHTIFPNCCLIAVSVYIPTNNKHQKRFLFLHNLSNVCYLIFFWYRWDVIAHWGFGLHFPDDWWCWAPSLIPFAIHMSSLETCVFKCSAHLFFFIIKCSISYSFNLCGFQHFDITRALNIHLFTFLQVIYYEILF